MDRCRICHVNAVRAEGEVCDACVGKITARAAGRPSDVNDPAVREFDAEFSKFGLDPNAPPRTSAQSGCAILAFAVAAVPAALAALGVVRLLS